MRRFVTLAVVALSVLSLAAAAGFAADAGSAAPAAETSKSAAKLGPSEVAIYIGDMHCNNCAKKIAAKLYRVKGVVKVRTSVKENLAVVTPQAKKQIDAKAAWTAVTKAGFEPTKMVSPQGTFVADEKTKEPQLVAESKPSAQS
ncbi:MAG: heavy metal transporter [Planctomycetota bacterium]|nr:MAG: heavy metal transporter [Planctomycetota bacterium]